MGNSDHVRIQQLDMNLMDAQTRAVCWLAVSATLLVRVGGDDGVGGDERGQEGTMWNSDHDTTSTST